MIRKKNLALGILFLILFAVWSLLVTNGSIDGFDTLVQDFILSIRSDGLTSFFKAVTMFGQKYIMLLVLCVILVFIKDNKKRLFGIVTYGGACVVGKVIKYIFKRSRPLILHLVEEDSYSYPSGHGVVSTIFFTILASFIKNSHLKKIYKYVLMSLCYVMIVVVCFSRVYLGVHFISDVIGGFLFSMFCFNACRWVFQYVEKLLFK